MNVITRNLLKFADKAQKYRLYCIVFLLSMVITQLIFGLLSLPHFTKLSNWAAEDWKVPWSNLSDMVDRGFAQSVGKVQEIFVEKPKPKEPAPCKKWRITACAMVHKEAAYLIEWIEFHRLQGVNHFVFYTYFTRDLPEYIPMFYEAAGINDIVDLIPARFFMQDPKRNITRADYEQNKEWSMTDCYNRFGKHSQWLLLMDAGHFVYSNTYTNITGFLDDRIAIAKKENIAAGKPENKIFTAVKIPTVRFGTSGQRTKFKTWLTPNAFSGSADLLYEPYLNSANLYPLVIESNPKRAPHRELDADWTTVPVCGDKDVGDELQLCSDKATVALVRSGRCPNTNVTECLKPTENMIWPELPVLRADNHNWRSSEYVYSTGYWDPLHNRTFEALDQTWFSSVKDELKFEYIEPLRKAIAKLNPRVFLDVGRECRADALYSTQQVMCPESHPYPFGNLGIKWLRDCCQTDFDANNEPLRIESGSCFNNNVVECVEPPGVQSWTHRSCCIYTPGFAKLKPKKKR